jgi:hypothetical protein
MMSAFLHEHKHTINWVCNLHNTPPPPTPPQAINSYRMFSDYRPAPVLTFCANTYMLLAHLILTQSASSLWRSGANALVRRIHALTSSGDATG